MIKKLDKLILKSFIGPFIITFFIAFFVLMMQGLWKYLDDLVGKGLDFITIGKFLWYVSASMLTLAMPIAILISTIMTFGCHQIFGHIAAALHAAPDVSGRYFLRHHVYVCQLCDTLCQPEICYPVQ
jgi:Lipopolysaccharide export system permease LptF/LptG